MTPVFPTTYFGSIAYFRELVKYPSIQLEAHEHFIKQTYRSRCEILGANGILSLSIPVKRPGGSRTPLTEIRLPPDENWRVRHWRAIKSAYQSAPYFDYYGTEVQELLLNGDDRLFSYNRTILNRMLQWLDLEVSVDHTSEFVLPQPNDYRDGLVGKSGNFPPIPAPYIQVFPGEKNYHERLSMLDAIFCIGPLARNLILPR